MQVYALSRTMIGLATALAVIGSMVMLIDFVELARGLGGGPQASTGQILNLTLLNSPSVILQLLPFVFLFGAMGAFVALNRRSELVAMRAAGLSAWRFILPTAAAAFVIGLITIAALNPAASALNGAFEDARADLTAEGASGAGQEVWLRQGDDRNQIVIHAAAHDTVDETVRLKGVSLFVQRVGPGGEVDFSRRIEAAEALLMPGYWRLRNVAEALPGASTVRSEQISIPSTLDRRTAMEKFASPGDIAFWGLPRAIRDAELAGYSVARYRVRLDQLLATPLLFSAMTVLGAAFSLRLMRLGGLAGLAVAGIGIGFAFFFLNQFCGTLGGTGVIPPSLAAWAPPVLALLSGITLLCYTEDG